jgi:hypothetical protein
MMVRVLEPGGEGRCPISMMVRVLEPWGECRCTISMMVRILERTEVGTESGGSSLWGLAGPGVSFSLRPEA